MLFSNCGKEEFVPIYEPGSMEYGWASAMKNGRNFEASGIGVNYPDYPDSMFVVHFMSYTSYGAEREILILGLFQSAPGQYKVSSENYNFDNRDVVSASYHTLQDDGDVAEDSYTVDLSYPNRVSIDFVSTEEWFARGTFDLKFKIKKPKRNLLNPDIVYFRNGEFEVRIKDN